MNDEQGTRGSKHGTDNLSRSPTPPKHTTTTPTNRGKGYSERKRKAEESVEVLNQLQTGKAEVFLLRMAEAQTALNAAAEEATTTVPGTRESDHSP